VSVSIFHHVSSCLPSCCASCSSDLPDRVGHSLPPTALCCPGYPSALFCDTVTTRYSVPRVVERQHDLNRANALAPDAASRCTPTQRPVYPGLPPTLIAPSYRARAAPPLRPSSRHGCSALPAPVQPNPPVPRTLFRPTLQRQRGRYAPALLRRFGKSRVYTFRPPAVHLHLNPRGLTPSSSPHPVPAVCVFSESRAPAFGLRRACCHILHIGTPRYICIAATVVLCMWDAFKIPTSYALEVDRAYYYYGDARIDY
jgi:hypothetical protein